jgi:ribonuclease G
MTKKMLIEGDPHQVRIAVLESDRLTEIFVEPRGEGGVVGNLYKGKVTRVLPGMQAAFVDIGLERDAFLYVADVVQVELEEGESEELRQASGAAARAEDPARSIEELLRVGQEVVVQVTKDAIANKGARVSTHVTLPSRYLVLLPTVEHIGISRRVESESERDRLRSILQEIGTVGGGLIVRTAGEGQSREEFERDARYLGQLWNRIQDGARKVGAPVLLHRDLDLALRVVRDVFSEEFSTLWVDEEGIFQRVVEFLDEVQPALASRVRLDRRESGLFDRFNIEQEIEAALSSKVWLKSGGYLVINQTEALVAIDVNTGRFVGQHSLEDTVLRTNLEAAKEIVRQIRLRDLSGILIIDLIDMTEPANREQVFAALESELAKDRARSKVLKISEFGLVEVTRKRSRANLERALTRRCPYCQGSGRIKKTTTICLNIRREALKMLRRATLPQEILLRVHPEVASALQTSERAILEELETASGWPVLLQSDAELHHERFDLSEA